MSEQAQWSTMLLDERVIKPDLWQDGESAAHRQQSAARYRRLVEVSPNAIFLNRANQLVYINAAGIALLGATDATQLLGKSPFDLFHPDSHGIIRERMHLMLTEGEAVGFIEEVVMRLDGTPIHVEVAAVPFTDHDGTPVIQVILHDITQRKQTEALERAQRQLAEALRDSLAALTSSLNVEKVMAQILASATTVVPCDGGSIILFEGATGRVAYLRGFAPDAVEFFREYRFGLDQLTGDAHSAAVGSHIVSDTRSCADWLALPPTQWIRSSLRTPIKLRGAIIGMLVLDSALPQHFQATDLEKLEAFADHSALALENANQFARLEAGVAARTAELQQAKEQVEAILNSSPDGIVLIDPALQIQQSNSAWLRLFDCPLHHCAGESLLTRVHAEDRQRVAALLQTVLLTQRSAQLELRACRHGGSTFEAELSVGPIKDGNLVCTVRDISDRKARERALRFFASLQENVSEAVIATDLDFQIQSWNTAAERIYGWRADEAFGQSAWQLLDPTIDFNDALLQQLLHKGHLRGERIHRCKDGSEVCVLIALSLLKDDHGEPFGLVAVVHDITERKRVEQALHASEARYRLLAENGNDMVIRVSLTGEYLYASPSSFNLLGYKSEELVGQLGFGMLHPEDVLRAQVALQEALAEEIFEQPITLRLRHKAGHYLWVDLSGRVIFHECSREPLELVATLRDVSERIQSAERLREERDFLQLVIDHVPDIIIVKDANGYLQLANEPTARLYNTTVAAMIGKTDEGFTADRAAIAAIRQQDQATLASGQPLLIAEEPVLLRYFQTTKIPLKNKNGAFDRLLVVASDITDRKVATEALREQRDFLQLVIDSVPALITVKGYDGMLYLINRRLAALYGLTPDEMIGQRDDAIPNTRVPIVVHRAEDQAVITSGQPLFVAEEKVHQRYYQKSKIPFQNADGHYDRVLMIATEITERKAAEEALEQALQKEKELGELKSRFISMASHEFRTPLTAIRATADTLLAYRHKLTEEQIAKRLVKIQDQVVYLTSIIEDVLQLTRLQVGAAALEPVGIDLDALCKLIIDELRSQRADLQRLVYHCDEALHVVMLDKKLMRHIITNLLSNAFKYSPGGEPVFLTLAHTGQALAITVRDAGIGIPERDLAYLFQPFHRAANVGNIPGSGLGLVITKESVELQGGTLTVASKVDVGTTFTVDIPLIAPHSTESEGVS